MGKGSYTFFDNMYTGICITLHFVNTGLGPEAKSDIAILYIVLPQQNGGKGSLDSFPQSTFTVVVTYIII